MLGALKKNQIMQKLWVIFWKKKKSYFASAFIYTDRNEILLKREGREQMPQLTPASTTGYTVMPEPERDTLSLNIYHLPVPPN